uniref:Uncharacterized protein n=1 Tax=Triticum urartu TaxID=4572 RepID=A0A8R7QKL0_TRIUA
MAVWTGSWDLNQRKEKNIELEQSQMCHLLMKKLWALLRRLIFKQLV